MPIEIRELVIKTVLVENQGAEMKRTSLSRLEIEKLKKEIVDSCVEKILAGIHKEKER
jgi:hypothetical protein